MASFMDEMPEGENLTLESNVNDVSSSSLADTKNVRQDASDHFQLVSFIEEGFQRSKDKRRTDEARWLECYRNYRGQYGPTTQFSGSEKSRAFIKITKTKVQAAVAQICDVLFAGNKFPVAVEPTRVPIAVENTVSFDPQKAAAPQESPLKANPQMSPQIAKLFGPKQKVLAEVEGSLESGVGSSPNAVIFEPALDAARLMEKKIHDQLDETNAGTHLRSTVFELALFGSGIMKGPLAIDKETPSWSKTGEYTPINSLIPRTEYVSIWDAYPDPDARNMAEVEKFIQRHRMSKTDLRALKKRPAFRNKVIEGVITDGPNYTIEYWESALIDDADATTEERWEVLEYWGICDTDIAKEAGIKLPAKYKGQDQVQINAWICNGHVLRLVFNPFKPSRIPYYVVPYEVNPYSVFGIGVAENMLDTQLLMNGFIRLMVDNAALSSNVVFEVNEDMLVPGQSMEIFPGKVFRKQGMANVKAIDSIKFDNVTQETMAAFDKFRQLADEATGMPSYAHGQTGVQSTNRTAAGMSMLMGAAAQNIKAVVRNIDDYLLSPLGQAYFSFNMQFNFKEDYIGEVEVVAKGTESLMRNEIRSQKLLQLGQFAASNPSIAPLVRWDYILREFAASLDLDEDKVVNDPRMAAIQAVQMQKMAQMSTPMPPEGGAPPQDPNAQGPKGGVPAPSDPTGTGNGNIAPGQAPEPGAEGFTG